jgi:hypothetical protein
MPVKRIISKALRGENIMDTEMPKTEVKQESQVTEQPAWYDIIVDTFKKLLQLSNFTYGTKKKF